MDMSHPFPPRRDHEHLEFEEMVLGTMRSSAFVEAEQCGAAGVKSSFEAGGALEGLEAAPRGKKKEKRSFGGRLKSAFLGSRGSRKKNLRKEEERRASEARAAAFLNMTEIPAVDEPDADAKYDDDDGAGFTTSDDDDDDDAAADDGPTHASVATVDAVKHRATTLAFYESAAAAGGGDGVPQKLGMVLASANHADVKAYDAENPHKEALKVLRGGVRATLGCGARPSASGALAVGGSEDGKILVWRLDGNLDSLPSELDASARNARVRAITAAVFAPPSAVERVLDPALRARYDAVLPEAFVVAADYSGRLLVAQREPVAHAAVNLDDIHAHDDVTPAKPKRPSVGAGVAPGTAVAPGSPSAPAST